jgi:hypothetical protein
LEFNGLEQDGNKVGVHYSWDYLFNIKAAGKIKRLASKNHEIEYSLSEEGTLASINLKKGEKRKLGKDFVLHF